jgi:aminoglycoside/choline kinase family phosphotransferase
VLDGTIRYWEGARGPVAGAPDFADFWRDVEWMGVQRHLKVLGIFARLHHRDSKAGYVEDTPRFVAYVRRRRPIPGSRPRAAPRHLEAACPGALT